MCLTVVKLVSKYKNDPNGPKVGFMGLHGESLF